MPGVLSVSDWPCKGLPAGEPFAAGMLNRLLGICIDSCVPVLAVVNGKIYGSAILAVLALGFVVSHFSSP